MKPKFRDAVVFALLLVLGSIFALNFCGCTPAQVQAMKDARQHVQEASDEAKAQTAGLAAEIAKLDPANPVRKALEDKLAKLAAAETKADEWIAKADPVIKAAETGDLTDPALKKVAESIPYGSLALTVISLAAFLVRNGQFKQLYASAGQIVQSVEAALPSKTPEQKLAMSAVQDESTKRLVDQLKVS